MRKNIQTLYSFCETLPERLYPFASDIEGRLVRGRRSYMRALEKAMEDYGPHRLGYRLTVYRATFHFLGSILFITLSALLAQRFLGNEMALYVLIFIAAATITFQEFYMHPRRYGQLTRKGVGDWLTWILPMLAYLYFVTF